MTNNENESRIAWLAEGNKTQARKRAAAKGIVQRKDGGFLLVNPTYKDYWDLPGGMAEANESPGRALVREMAEELGINVKVGRLLALDWVGPHGPWDDQLVFVFETDTLTDELAADLKITDNEISEFGFFSLNEAKRRLRVDVAARLERAVNAMSTDRTHYVENQAPNQAE